MRFDDPQRPCERHLGEETRLHVSRSPLPAVTLVRPIQTERALGYCCVGMDRCAETSNEFVTTPCPGCTQLTEPCWGWLACIHAHRAGNRYGYHTGIIPDLGRFAQEWLEDPEACLARYFKYFGPAETTKPAKVTLPDLWETET